jgi:sialate O-acetylesterase
MEGCGWLDGALQPDGRVWSFATKGVWELAREPLHRLWQSYAPVHQEINRGWLTEDDRRLSDAELAKRADLAPTGAGLGLSFATAMAEAVRRPIGLIPAAHGGTSLDLWSERRKPQGLHSLYGAMLDRIARAGGRLRGLLWYQGESDANIMKDSLSYAPRLDSWIAALRADTGYPELPVIVVQIGRVLEPPDRAGIWPGWDLVREALATLPQRTAFTAVTSAVDLPLVDLIHVSTQGLIRLGKRCARLALRLTEGRDEPPGPTVTGVERESAPGGVSSALRVRFRGVTGGWTRTDGIRGFQVQLPDPSRADPLFVINAVADRSDPLHSVIVYMNRDPGAHVMLSYGRGVDPCCDLVDQADMPLCSFRIG